MKVGLIFVLLLLLLFFFYKSDARKISLQDGKLKIYDKSCNLQIRVKSLKYESDLIDELMIDREYLELPNKQEIVVERINLTNQQHAIKMPYNELIENIFRMHVKEYWEKSGVVIYEGDFYVAVFYKSKNDLTLLYPLDSMMANAIKSCKEPDWSQVKIPKIIKPKWDIKLIITEGLIGKNI
ncbi:hypothetical protein [Nitratiruptor sp. YY09-18]|uniref:hypothetical protein n=1 Tax=Nitratiruptor sp. YY09-18 TaxID=2724901 RepID=UPI0019160BFA|nr:hypothetical protein [Nitratiruptor sp. YY09-18]BCD68557.1 hypothetical protein NitYY0918_C1474 [Nitratiruptor sp. YY09-18]